MNINKHNVSVGIFNMFKHHTTEHGTNEKWEIDNWRVKIIAFVTDFRVKS